MDNAISNSVQLSIPSIRRSKLKEAINLYGCIRVLETHNPISALIAENVNANDVDSGMNVEYQGFWSSSLTDSVSRGKPDIEFLDIKSRMLNISDIFEVTSKPLIIDGDTGGKVDHFLLNIRSLERLGVSAIIVEDKTGLKKNSLFGNEVEQDQATIGSFCTKIKRGKDSQLTQEFMIIARVESLILEAGMNDALERAFAYSESGADGVMIHSRSPDGQEIFEFAKEYRAKYPNKILVCVPTSYNEVKFNELKNAGFNVVIYANHMLRAAYKAMEYSSKKILKNGRTFETEPDLLSIRKILDLVPGTR
ncbi:phosphoenolpyruvate mutase [Photobacterium profundum]|uniref:phosphoenolpyruvate mutase n=1 Tax=Photobacterium profundum 3TCK TaxID=314280 RepID=Q1YYL1_9GAMM|nr:phosphoenolpyruvate mutase [Photobacterium profundum]EAS41311.1 phosphoenolpyruvate phosphomutase [Photobacterium profundum 3TCK]PSV57536.1 phosphoenolpyruvate mutase [Photobacterium profundum]